MRVVLHVFLFSRFLVILAVFLGQALLPENPIGASLHTDASWLVDAGVRWDARYYAGIVEDGYGAGVNAAFWPGYPLVLKLITMVVGLQHLPAVGVLVSNLAFFLALYYLYRLLLLDYPQAIASRTVLYLALFPTSFFFSAFYPESLYLLAVVAAFYAWRSERRLLACALGYAAALIHVPGALLLLPFGVEYIQRRGFDPRRFDRDSWALLLIPGGLLTFVAYLQYSVGDSLAFLTAAESWGHALAWPWDTLGRALPFVRAAPWREPAISLYMLVASLLLLLLSARSLRSSYALWALAVLALYVILPSQTVLNSVPRYVLILFPLFVSLARLGRHPLFHLAWLSISGTLLIVLTALFVRWYFVA